MILLLVAVSFAAVLGALLALMIGLAAKAFAIESDSLIEPLSELLNGGNCGACGVAGCLNFAKEMAKGTVIPSQCPMASPKEIQKMATLLKITPKKRIKKVALIRCSGDKIHASRSPYDGVQDCRSAILVAGGAKGCDFGCLGFGSCAKVCPFDAIEMRNGLAIVHPERCVGCEKCVLTCPKGLIVMVPASVDIHVYCNSPEKGALKRKVCKTACIGCRKCIRESDHEDQMTLKGFLVETNYDNPPPPSLIEKAGCPTTALRRGSQHAAGTYGEASK